MLHHELGDTHALVWLVGTAIPFALTALGVLGSRLRARARRRKDR